MKIESSAVQMDSTYSASQISLTSHTVSESFTLATTRSGITNISGQSSTRVGNQKDYGYAFPNTLIYIPATENTVSIEESFQDLNQRLLQHIIDMMRKLISGRNFRSETKEEYLTSDSTVNRSGLQTWQRTQTVDSYYSEREATTFDTKGIVKTSDGRELSFSLSLSMSRNFIEETQISEKLSDVMTFYDPLVINMDVPTAAVTDQKFLFDIDQDGTSEKISSLAKGSGFLALDKNGDGIINDGSELFGTKSGDGFKDLAQYDLDGNGWIDENDAIFECLRVWTKDINGNDILLSLKEADVGAIYLDHISTGFDLKDSETNDTHARVQSSGVFLHESTGLAGTIQHVDFSA